MGRGDKKSKKGKLWRGSFGVSRNKAAIKSRMKRSSAKKTSSEGEAPAKPKRTVAKKKAEA